jgi:AcrR family transcriptional regulator
MQTRTTRAERRERTRDELVAAADRCFVDGGFHATSLDLIAAEAGYTKGAVYSNFASKEDLFFAVYERRVDRVAAEAERLLAEHGMSEALKRLLLAAAQRRGGREDGWLAVFYEFWAHTVRHPELRMRFARIHARVIEPYAEATARLAADGGLELPVDPRGFTVAVYAMSIGLSLEQLTQPDVVDATLAGRMISLVLKELVP